MREAMHVVTDNRTWHTFSFPCFDGKATDSSWAVSNFHM